MFGTLLKKQFLELNSLYFINRKTGKKRSALSSIGLIVLFVFLLCMIGGAVYFMAAEMCKGFCAVGIDWFYFSMMGIVALLLSVFGSVFNTYASLYLAKDNELLLSMPIKSSVILSVRMIGVFAIGLMYEAVVYIPTLIAWIIYGNPTALSLVYSVLMMFVLGIFSLAISCIAGFIVAYIAVRIKKNSVVTAVAALLFICVYYYVYFNFTKLLKTIIVNGDKIALGFKDYAYITYLFGKAAVGDTKSFIIISLFAALVFWLSFTVLSKFFKNIVSYKKGKNRRAEKSADHVLNSKKITVSKLGNTLLRREFKKFLSSSLYMLNCGLGALLMVLAAVVMIIKATDIKDALNMILPSFKITGDLLKVAVTTLVCMMISMCMITAPSISLEGNTLWLIKSLPVSPKEIFDAKQKMAVLIISIPAFVLSVTAGYVFGFNVVGVVLITAFCILFSVFVSALGLWLNIKMPNFTWKNENFPIKQSAPVSITLLGSMGICLLFAGGYYPLRNILSSTLYIVFALILMACFTALLEHLIKTKGVQLFGKM